MLKFWINRIRSASWQFNRIKNHHLNVACIVRMIFWLHLQQQLNQPLVRHICVTISAQTAFIVVVRWSRPRTTNNFIIQKNNPAWRVFDCLRRFCMQTLPSSVVTQYIPTIADLVIPMTTFSLCWSSWRKKYQLIVWVVITDLVSLCLLHLLS